MDNRMIFQGLVFSLTLVFLGACSSTIPAEVDASDSGSPVGRSPTQTLPGVAHEYLYLGQEKHVKNADELQWAISIAKPGDVITLATGVFPMEHKISLKANGTASKPITIRAAANRKSNVQFSERNGVVEGFTVSGEYWIIDGLMLTGTCSPEHHSKCEHAIHVKSGATGLIVRNNKIVDFNAAIKGSGSTSNNLYANNVHIEHNEIFNTTVRMTSNPSTSIDINGGDGWRIYKNSIYDFAKGMGNQISYGVFLKANSSNGVMDSNWLQCQKDVAAPGARVGLSFGGGGNTPINSPICKDSDCSILHRNGRMTNNVIANCSDVGIYINASSNTLIQNNTLLSTTGIDVRFKTSTARISANVLIDGEIRERDEGKVVVNDANFLRAKADVPSLRKLLSAVKTQSITEPPLGYDICGNQRQTTVIGAFGGTLQEQEACMTEFQ